MVMTVVPLIALLVVKVMTMISNIVGSVLL